MVTTHPKGHLLTEAAHNGNVRTIKRLLSSCDATLLNHTWDALRYAATSGHVECVAALIPYSDPKAYNSQILKWVVGRNMEDSHLECIRLLIPVSDCKADGSAALVEAVMNKDFSCMELLYPYSDPYQALDSLKTKHPEFLQHYALLEEFIARTQREQLEQVTPAIERPSVSRKM